MELKTPETEIELKTYFDEEGNLRYKKKSEMIKGTKAKKSGGQFETRVRKDLENKGWIVDKWSNNIDLEERKITPAKRKFNPFSKVMTIGTGFPDFLAMQLSGENTYSVIGVEVKINGNLSREEKEKSKYYLEKKVFSQILIAKKNKKGRNITIEYTDVKDILARMK